MHGSRLLICGPLADVDRVGGLRLALEDLASALQERGWDVDLAITSAALELPGHATRGGHLRGLIHARWAILPTVRFLPADLRILLQHMLLDGGLARVQSDVMHALQKRLRERQYDAVIACVAREAPGLAHFIVQAHPNVLLLSLNGLPGELRLRRWLVLPRLIASVAGRRWIHRSLYRPVNVQRIRMAVFASEGWRREAVRAGFPEERGRTIYFGLRDVPALNPPVEPRNRLVWVGRLSREKGLHHFLEALPVIRRRRAVTLTAVCGQGPENYRREILGRIAQLGLEDVVRLRPPVPRDELATIYREHDALLFHSAFSEPVALVVAEAFAAGLPVVAPLPEAPSALLRPNETCVCFSPTEPAAVAAAVERVLGDDLFRVRMREQAHALLRKDFHLQRTGAAYDDALGTLLATAPA